MTWVRTVSLLGMILGLSGCWHGARATTWHPQEPPRVDPWRQAPIPEPKQATPAAIRYGSMDRESCIAELRQRGAAFREVTTKTPGVLAPIRLEGPLNGVVYRTELSPQKRATAPWEVFDCRLALALHDFSNILRAHQISEVLMFSAWRPPGKGWPGDRIGKRHPGALALDARRFRKLDGTLIDVKRDFHGRIGHETCGESADPPRKATEGSYLLRSIVCRTAEARIFNSILTPNYDKPHEDHLHLEVTAGVKWFFLR